MVPTDLVNGVMLMMRISLPFLMLGLTAGCGLSPDRPLLGPGQPSATGASHQGRFLAQYVEDDGGEARRYLGMFDRLTGQSCQVTATTVDEVRIAYCPPELTASVYFLDPACTQPVIETTAPPGAWVTAWGYGPTSGPLRIGARVAPVMRPRYTLSRGCNEYGVFDDSPLYEVAEIAELETFELGQIRDQDVRENLRASWLDRADGPALVHHLTDLTAQIGCAPQHTEAGPRCGTELGEVHDVGLRNETCDQLAAADYGSLGVSRVPERAEAIYRFSPVSWGVAHGVEGPNGTCERSEDSFGRMTLHFAQPYPMSQWPQLTYDGATTARLQSLSARLPSGASAHGLSTYDARAVFKDTLRQEECGPAWVDGGVRCVPAPPPYVRSWVEVFTDASCTRPGVPVPEGELPPQAISRLVSTDAQRQDGLRTMQVLQVTGPVTQGYIWASRVNRCQPATIPERIYGLGSALDPESLARLHIVAE